LYAGGTSGFSVCGLQDGLVALVAPVSQERQPHVITADARSRITPQDIDLLSAALGLRGATVRGLDAVLDRREVATYLLDGRMPGPSPSLFFYVLVRHSLLDVGVDDPTVADYFAAMLREFGVGRRATRVDDVDDQDHRYLVDILTELAVSTGDRQFRISVHLGNYALWLSGVFPERIAAQRLRRGGPDVSYYESLGGRGYAGASEHRLAEQSGLEDVLRTAAERVHEVRLALNRVSSRLDLRGPRLAA
jgi:hypothetical protein